MDLTRYKMKKIELTDIKNILDYEREREEFRDRIIQAKKNRRIAVGDVITLVFENRETVLFQIQEMVRVERIIDPAKIQDEIDVYNELLPGPGELSATLFIEVSERSEIKPTLQRLLGLTRPGTVRLEIGQKHRVDGQIEGGREEEAAGRLSAVQYVKFYLGPEAADDFLAVWEPVYLVIDHPNYEARAQIAGELLASLRSDLDRVSLGHPGWEFPSRQFGVQALACLRPLRPILPFRQGQEELKLELRTAWPRTGSTR